MVLVDLEKEPRILYTNKKFYDLELIIFSKVCSEYNNAYAKFI